MNEPYADCVRVCAEAGVGSALGKSRVILDRVDDTDVKERVRLRYRGRGEGVAEYIFCGR